MELTNKREIYSVSNADTNLKLTGEVTYSNGSIVNFSGSLSDLSNLFVGNFNYNEADVNCNINVSNCLKSQVDNAYAIVDATIEQIKTQLTV